MVMAHVMNNVGVWVDQLVRVAVLDGEVGVGLEVFEDVLIQGFVVRDLEKVVAVVELVSCLYEFRKKV